MEEVDIFLSSLLVTWALIALAAFGVGHLLKMRIKLNLLCFVGVALGFLAFRSGEWHVVSGDLATGWGWTIFGAGTMFALLTPLAALVQYSSFLMDLSGAFGQHGYVDGGLWWWVALASYAIVMLSLFHSIGIGTRDAKPSIADRLLTIALHRASTPTSR